jgi:hypothetical protein
MSVKGKDKTGKMRIQCSCYYESGDCPNPVMTSLDVVERKVIDTVIRFFSSPDDIDILLKNARAEARKPAGDKINERVKLERRLGEALRSLQGRHPWSRQVRHFEGRRPLLPYRAWRSPN